MTKWIVGLCCVLATAAAVGQGLESVFPHARVVYKSDVEVSDYRLALGPLRKIESVWQPEREERLSGVLQRRTLEIPEGYSVEEIHRRLQDALERLQARALYICAGLDCGSSNAWANNYFDIKQLYGLDQNQYYGAWEVREEQGVHYLATYVVQRGNRRIYVQVDRLDTPEQPAPLLANPATLVETLKGRGYFVMTGVRFNADGVVIEPDHLQTLVNALRRDPWIKVHVVGHDYGSGDLSQRQSRSRGYARELREALLKAGIDEERITAHGVGSLAPAGGTDGARLEIVRQE